MKPRLHLLGLFASFSLAVLSGCSAPTDGGPTEGSEAEAKASKKTAFHLTATLGEVTAGHAEGHAHGMWTTIELAYQVACDESFDTFDYALRSREDGGTDLIVNAVGTRTGAPGTLRCMGMTLEKKSVTVPGTLAKDDIHLVNLEASAEPLLETTASIEPIRLRVEATRSLCPPNAMCIHGGTIVQLKTVTPVSCVDKIAPVAYAVEPSTNGKVKLAVGAIRMVDKRRVRCASMPADVEIELPEVYASVETLELTAVGGMP
jgi:hypothetical protein